MVYAFQSIVFFKNKIETKEIRTFLFYKSICHLKKWLKQIVQMTPTGLRLLIRLKVSAENLSE